MTMPLLVVIRVVRALAPHEPRVVLQRPPLLLLLLWLPLLLLHPPALAIMRGCGALSHACGVCEGGQGEIGARSACKPLSSTSTPPAGPALDSPSPPLPLCWQPISIFLCIEEGLKRGDVPVAHEPPARQAATTASKASQAGRQAGRQAGGRAPAGSHLRPSSSPLSAP